MLDLGGVGSLEVTPSDTMYSMMNCIAPTVHVLPQPESCVLPVFWRQSTREDALASEPLEDLQPLLGGSAIATSTLSDSGLHVEKECMPCVAGVPTQVVLP
jgi:hypothetical protein